MVKKSTLKARGIRFSDKAWAELTKDAEKKDCFVSDLVREIINNHYDPQVENKKS